MVRGRNLGAVICESMPASFVYSARGRGREIGYPLVKSKCFVVVVHNGFEIPVRTALVPTW